MHFQIKIPIILFDLCWQMEKKKILTILCYLFSKIKKKKNLQIILFYMFSQTEKKRKT